MDELLPDLPVDTRPKYLRISSANFAAGYLLCIERPRSFAEWRKRGEQPRGISFEMAMRVAKEMGEEFGDRIIRIGIGTLREAPFGKPLEQSRGTKMTKQKILLDRLRYKQYELAKLIGSDTSTVRAYDDELTIERGGDYPSAPKFYLVDRKLVEWLEGRGFRVEVALPAGDEDEPVETSGDGQVGAEPEETEPLERVEPDRILVIEEDWTPAPENIDQLPEPLRMYVEDLQDSGLRDYQQIEKKDREIERLQREVSAHEETLEVLSRVAENLGRERDGGRAMYGRLEASIVETFARQCPTLTYTDPAQALEVLLSIADGQVKHAHAKGRADAEYEITRLYEAPPPAPSKGDVAISIDAIDRTCRVLHLVKNAVYFECERTGGDLMHDGMAYVLLDEIDRLVVARDRLNASLSKEATT